MGQVIPSTGYSFNAAAKTVTFNPPYNTIELENISLITNEVTGDIIYQFNKAAKLGTLALSVLTLVYNTTGMNDADTLRIDINWSGISTGGDATAVNQTTEISRLTDIKTAVEIIDNFISGNRGLVTEDNSAAILAKIIAAPSTEVKQDTIITGLTNLLTELQLKADLTDTQPVSLVSVPLPTGASTSANQTNQITQETAINTVLGATADVAVQGDNIGTQSAKLRGINKYFSDLYNQISNWIGVKVINTVTVDGTVLITDVAKESKQDVGNTILASILKQLDETTTDSDAAIIAGIGDGKTLRNIFEIVGEVYNAVLPSPESPYAPDNSTSTVYEADRLIKTGYGVLYSINGFNSNADPQFIQIHDNDLVAADGDIPVIIIYVQGKSNFSISADKFGRYFQNGIYLCNSSTGDTKTLGADDCWFDCQFK